MRCDVENGDFGSGKVWNGNAGSGAMHCDEWGDGGNGAMRGDVGCGR